MSKYKKNLTEKNVKVLKSNEFNSEKKVGRPPKSDWSSIEDAKKFAKKNNIETSSEWRKWVKLNKIPSNFPKQPDKTYKNMNKWISWKAFFDKEKEVTPKIKGNTIKTVTGYKDLFDFLSNDSINLKNYLGKNLYSLIEIISLVNSFEKRIPSTFKEIQRSLLGYTQLKYNDKTFITNLSDGPEENKLTFSMGELLNDKKFEFSYFASVYINLINNFNASYILNSSLMKELEDMPDVMSSLKDKSSKINIKVYINDKKINLEDETITLLSALLQINKNSMAGLGLGHIRSFNLKSKDSLIEQLGYIKPRKYRPLFKKVSEKIEEIRKNENFPFDKEKTIYKIENYEFNKEIFDNFITKSLSSLIKKIQHNAEILNYEILKSNSLAITLSQIREIINVPRRVIAENMPDKNISQSTIMHIERFGTYPGDEKNHPEKAFNLIVGIFRSYKYNPSSFLMILDQSSLFHESILNPAWKYFNEKISDIDIKDSALKDQLIEFKSSISDIKNNYKNKNFLNEYVNSQWSKIVLLYWLAKEEVFNSPIFNNESKNNSSLTTKISEDIYGQTDERYFHLSPQGLSLISRYKDKDGEDDIYTDLFIENINSYFNKESNSNLSISRLDNKKENYQISNQLLPHINKNENLQYFQLIDESMEPKISKHDTVIVSKINIENIQDIKFGKIYALRDDYGINIRSIMQPGSLTKGLINIHSYNIDWPSSDIDFSSVNIIGIVRGIIKET
jgi:hypothetical protein